MNNIDNLLLIDMIKGGKLNLELHKELINNLNVFPVPDGDTGTNMSLTIASSVKEIDALLDSNTPNIMQALSKGALKGARGNSGVILSQIFKGFATVFAKQRPLNAKAFAEALKAGAISAYDAVSIPKEGTILTVIRVMGDYANRIAGRKNTLLEFFEAVLKKGEETLEKTPEMLPVLKKAGVVDAGGKGLLVIFWGMYNVLAGIEMKLLEEDEVAPAGLGQLFADVHDLDNIQFGYCTEYFITNLNATATTADIERLRLDLGKIGDSVIVVGDLQLVKVHVHTNKPNKALEYALKLGELDKLKIENMHQQHRELVNNRQRQDKKRFGMLAISSGSGLKEVFSELGVDVVLEGGQTMNPSVSDIVGAVDSIAAQTVFVLPNNKNIILAAEQARELARNKLVVIATENIPEGVAAAIAFDENSSEEQNATNMQAASGSVRCVQITHAIRDAEIDGFQLKVGDIIAVENEIIAKGGSSEEVITEVFNDIIDDSVSTVTLYYGEQVEVAQAQALCDTLREKYVDVDIDICYGGQQYYFYIISIE